MPARSWVPGFLALAVIWGSSFLLIKVGVSELPALYVSCGRVLSAAVVLLVIALIRRERPPGRLVVWGHNAVVGVLGVAAPFSLFAYGEQRISSSLAGIWNSMTPLVVLPLAVLVFGTERMSARKVVGLALGFVGALVILGVWQGVGGSALSGQLMCLGAAACYGVAIPYTKRFVAPLSHSGVVMSAIQMLAGSLVLVVAAPLVHGPPPDPRGLSPHVVAAVGVLGAVGTGIAFLINLHNIRTVGASTASMVTYVIPVFATLIGVLVLHEHVTWHQPVGVLIVLLGVAVAQDVLRRPLRWQRDLGGEARRERG